MRPIEYASPTTLEQVVGLLASSWSETEILAGGTDLLSLMKDDIVAPNRLVNIKDVDELKGIHYDAGTGLRLGALVTIQELLDDPNAKRSYPALTRAAEGIASPQIRNMGTVAGELCQRPRCWYYRAGYGLLARDGKGQSLVLEGDNRYHAILGNSGPAYFVNPSSLAPALIALGARLRVFGPQGRREILLEKFYRIPQSDDEREYNLLPNEVVTNILIPSPQGTKNATYEVRQKESLDWPLATASVVLNLNGDRVRSARVVIGHVAPVPWPSPAAERALVGKPITEETAQAAGRAALEKAKKLGRNGYKIQLARVAVKRAILQIAQGGAQ